MKMNSVKEFYKALLKSELSLLEREKIENILVASIRKEKKREWAEIVRDQPNYLAPIRKLQKRGYLEFQIPYVEKLIDQIKKLPTRGRDDNASGNRKETEYLDGVSNLSTTKALCSEKKLNNLVSLYLGAPAHIYSLEAWWQYPMPKNTKPSNAQLWHRDRDDFAFLKLFINLTDVDELSGPHSYLPGTHKSKLLSQMADLHDEHSKGILNGVEHKFITDEEIKLLQIPTKPKVWIGQAGTAFLEDTRGFHKAIIPKSKPRLLLSLTYTVGPGYNWN